MNITYRQMQKEDIAKVTPLFIEYWNGTGDEWIPILVYSRVWQVSIIVALTVVVLAILQIFQIWTQAINLCMPLMGINLLCQTYMQWNTSRKTAYFSLGFAGFIFVCAIVVFWRTLLWQS